MAALLQIGLVNAALATLLACLVALIAKKVRRPALIHALWIIVLAKLVSPPLIEIPIEVPFPIFSAAARIDDSPSAATDPQTAATDEIASARQSDDGHVVTAAADGSETSRSAAFVAQTETASQPGEWSDLSARLVSTAATAFALSRAWLLRNIVAVVGWTWLGGAALWFLRQALTTLRYSRRLALATPAPPALQQQADDLSRAMGLSYRPPVLIVRDVISPMLWGIGQNTRLLFPVDLLARLESGARETLIAHELAHFRRGDHWVRAFELIVSGIFWWHPVVWWARREIEIAEEECCDAWVIEQFPETPRCYAEALLTTIDFLSGEGAILPPAAAGLGHVPFLKRRLTAIMRGAAPKAMSGPAWLAVLVAAAASLPLHPGLTPAVARPTPTATLATVTDDLAADPLPIVADLGKFATEFPETFGGPPATSDWRNDSRPERVEDWAVAKSPRGNFRIARCGRESNVSLFNYLSEKTDKEIDLSEYHIITVVFAPDGKTFATGGSDKAVRVWASSTGEVLKTFWGHPGPVQAVAFLDEGKKLFSASRDGTLKLWDLELELELTTRQSPFSPVNSVSVSPDGRWLALGSGSWKKAMESPESNGGQVTILDPATLHSEKSFPCAQAVGAVAFKSDSNTLISGDWWGRLTFWDVGEEQCLGTTLPQRQYKNAVAAAQFSPDTEVFSRVEPGNVIFQSPEDETPSIGLVGSLFFGQSASLAPGFGAPPESADRVPVGSDADRDQIQRTGQSGIRPVDRRLPQREQRIGFPGEIRTTRPGAAPDSRSPAPQYSAPRSPLPVPSEPGD